MSSYQGQYAYQIAYQGVSLYGFQTAGNMLAFVSGLIAAALYGNIGIVCLYFENQNNPSEAAVDSLSLV